MAEGADQAFWATCVTQGPEGEGGEEAQGSALDLLVGEVAEVVKDEVESGDEVSHGGLVEQLGVEEVFESSGDRPSGLAVVEDDGDDERERQGFGGGLGFGVSLEDADDVAEQSQRHELVRAALVLEEDVEKGGLAVNLGREEQVGLRARQGLVDVGAGAEGECGEVGQRDELRWQNGSKFGSGVLNL